MANMVKRLYLDVQNVTGKSMFDVFLVYGYFGYLDGFNQIVQILQGFC